MDCVNLSPGMMHPFVESELSAVFPECNSFDKCKVAQLGVGGTAASHTANIRIVVHISSRQGISQVAPTRVESVRENANWSQNSGT